MAFEIIAVNSAYCCQNTDHRQLMALTNSLKISYQIEGNFFQLNLPRIDEKRG